MIFFLNFEQCSVPNNSHISDQRQESDFIYHVRRVNRADKWSEKDKKLVKDLVSKWNKKAPALKIFYFRRPFDFCHLSKMILEAFLTFVSYLFGSHRVLLIFSVLYLI